MEKKKKRKKKKEKRAGRRKGKPFHVHHHPVKQVMHSNMASGLGIFKTVFYLQHCSIFILYFCTVILAMEGGTSPCSYHAPLSCFRDVPEKRLCYKPLLLSIFYFWFLFFPPWNVFANYSWRVHLHCWHATDVLALWSDQHQALCCYIYTITTAMSCSIQSWLRNCTLNCAACPSQVLQECTGPTPDPWPWVLRAGLSLVDVAMVARWGHLSPPWGKEELVM